MAKAAPLVIDRKDRATLQGWARARKLPAGQVQRAKAILLIGHGASHAQVARQMATSRQTVVSWRARFETDGPEGLKDRAKSGRPPRIDELAVVAETLADNGVPPRQLGVTHWSARLMARRMTELGEPVSFAEVARIWRAWGIQPHRVATFKFSTDPQLEAKLRDVVGLYLSPPANAVVVSVDEKSQIQALDRTQPMLPVRPGLPERQTHDYKRHGTTSLFAALETATGRISAHECYQRHTHVEFLKFLKKLARAHPRVELHVICDNYSTHKHEKVQAWLAKHPRIRMHFTPTGCSWLNMVEIFFGILTRQAIRRGTFTSVTDLQTAIDDYIHGYNDRAEPFTWTKTADQILTKIQP